MHRSTQHTETPDCYATHEQAINTWLESIHNNGLATDSEKKDAQKRYNQLFINKFRTDGKGSGC